MGTRFVEPSWAWGGPADTGSVFGGAGATAGEIYTLAASTVMSLCTQDLTVPAMLAAGM